MFKRLYPYKLRSVIVDSPRMGLPPEHLLRRGRRQEEDRREERHCPHRCEHLDRFACFDTLYLLFLNLIVVKALDLLIYISALNLIVMKALALLNYFNALNLIIVKALNLIVVNACSSTSTP